MRLPTKKDRQAAAALRAPAGARTPDGGGSDVGRLEQRVSELERVVRVMLGDDPPPGAALQPVARTAARIPKQFAPKDDPSSLAEDIATATAGESGGSEG